MLVLRIKILIGFARFAILLLYYKMSPIRGIIDKDIERWIEELHVTMFHTKPSQLVYLLWFHPQFRNLFYFVAATFQTHSVVYATKIRHCTLQMMITT